LVQPRLIATDVDDTLVETQGAPISEFTLRTLRALLDRGFEVTLVTGLNPWVTRRYVRAIGDGIRAVCLNGIFTLEDGHLQPGRFVDEAVARRAVAVTLEERQIPLVYGEDGVTRYMIPEGADRAEFDRLVAEREDFQPYEGVCDASELFNVRPAQLSVCDYPARTLSLYHRLREAVGKVAYVVHQPNVRSWVEVNHPEGRKDVALLAMADRLGIPREQILYFGDSLNDLPVFRELPHAVAVANAHPEVKALAWRMADAAGEDGVARFLRDHLALSTT
jgi:hypothetical protein